MKWTEPFANLVAAGAALAGLSALAATAPSITEPATVFYGKVTGTASDRPFPVTEGELVWTIRRADGGELNLRTRLRPIADSDYAYRLNVPHAALAAGLVLQSDSIPLKATSESHSHLRITINGVPATIAGPGGPTFDTAQLLRAATHELNLEVPLEAADSDGDGIPDWWEKLHSLDQIDSDDPDGDGISNRLEYLAGSDPRKDDRVPVLTTTELTAYADASSGVFLRAIDADTPPEQITYTLTAPPEGAELRLRNAQSSPIQPDVPLGTGATFTQADIQSGRLVLVHGGTTLSTSFSVTLRDGSDATPSEPQSVAVQFYRPAASTLDSLSPAQRRALAEDGGVPQGVSGPEVGRFRRYLQATERGAIPWDLAADSVGLQLASAASDLPAHEYKARYGEAPPQVIQGGYGPDDLRGGPSGDDLSGGPGDDHLTGGEGPDRFTFGDGDGGTDTVVDFLPDQGDTLDLRGFLSGLSGDLRPHLNASGDAAGTVLHAQRDGRSVTIRLPSVPFASENLRQWLDAGAVRVGDLHLPPAISWAVREGRATENGPGEAELVLSRSGATHAAAVVQLSIGGSAVNGEDIASLPATVTIPAGERTARVVVRPLVDSRPEPEESVEITLLNSDDYLVTGPATATVTIADLLPVISIEALEPVATLEPIAPGSVLIRREALIDRSVLVRMEIRGSASAGTDYATVSRFVNLTPGQTTALISVAPQPDAVLDGGAETVEFVVVEDPEYLIGPKSVARVTLVRKTTTLAEWRQQHFPDFNGSLEAFGSADSNGTGVSHLLRYAFGMDPDQPDRARLPKIVVRDGYLTVDVHRRPGATDIEVIADVSTELGNWESGGGRIEQVYPAELAGNPGMICFRALPPLAEAPSLFVNIRVVLRP